MDKTVLSLLDEQPTGDGRLPLDGDSCGASGRVHGGIGEGECGGRCGGVCEICWEFDGILMGK